jgi:hypothetical protein
MLAVILTNTLYLVIAILIGMAFDVVFEGTSVYTSLLAVSLVLLAIFCTVCTNSFLLSKMQLKIYLFLLTFCSRKLSLFSRNKTNLYTLHKVARNISDRFTLSSTATLFLYYSQ